MRENAEKALLIKPKSDVVTTMKYHFCFTYLVVCFAGWWWSTLLVAILA